MRLNAFFMQVSHPERARWRNGLKVLRDLGTGIACTAFACGAGIGGGAGLA